MPSSTSHPIVTRTPMVRRTAGLRARRCRSHMGRRARRFAAARRTLGVALALALPLLHGATARAAHHDPVHDDVTHHHVAHDDVAHDDRMPPDPAHDDATTGAQLAPEPASTALASPDSVSLALDPPHPVSPVLDPLLWADPTWRTAGPDDLVEVLLLLEGAPAYDRWLATGGRPAQAVDAARDALARPLDLAMTPGAHVRQPAATLHARRAVPPAAVALEAHARAVRDAQADTARALRQAGGYVVASYDTAANALLVQASRASLEHLAQRREVLRVLPAPRLRPVASLGALPRRPVALGRTTSHIRADVAAAAGWTGRGVTIAIVDSGVDYTHRALGGAGGYADNDPDLVEEGSFPSTKVIGGYDFAGSAYTGAGMPRPDDDPLDEAGHGSHVAGIAAGTAGAAGVHPGVARDASIVALKLFGRRGGTNLVLNALEWILEARLGRAVQGTPAVVDVVNLSLGSPWTAGALEATGVFGRLEDAGVLSVAAAGNDGRVAFIVGGPAALPGVLAVGSTNGPGERSDMVRVHGPQGPEDIEAVEAHPSLAPDLSATGDVRAPLAWAGRGCAQDRPQMVLRGRVALLARGTCTFHEKLSRAAGEGAVAALVYDDGRGLVPMGSEAGTVGIPAAMIPRRDGQALRDRLLAGASVEAELSTRFRDGFERTASVDTVSAFSSRGPTRAGRLAPDLSAPGAGIAAPAAGSTSGAVVQSGTSMASPVVAGAAAVLLHRLRAEGLYGSASAPLEPRDAMAMLVATSAPAWRGDARDGRRAAVARAGAGRVDLGAVVGTGTVARLGQVAAANMGVHAFADEHVDERKLRLRNLRATPRRYGLSIGWPDPEDGRGVRWVPEPAEVELGPRGSAEVLLGLRAVAAEMRAYHVATGGSAMNGDARLHEPEHDAWLEITELDQAGRPLDDGDRLRLPLWLFARGASHVEVAPGGPGGAEGPTPAPVSLRNRGGQQGRLELFAALARDAVGDASGWLDVDWVGARVLDGPGSPTGRRLLEILVHFRQPRTVPYERAPTLRLDLDQDGATDVRVELEDEGFLASGGTDPRWSGVLATVAYPVSSDPTGLAPEVHPVAGVDVAARWIVLRVDPSLLGFAAQEPVSFSADLTVEDRFSGGRRDQVGRLEQSPMRFDQAAPAIAADRWSLPLAPDAAALLRVVTVDGGQSGLPALGFVPANEPAHDLLLLEPPPGDVPPTATVLPTASATPPASATPDAATPPSASPTADASATATATATVTAVRTATPTGTSTAAGSPTAGPSASATRTPSATTTASPAASATEPPTPSATPSAATPPPGASQTPTPDASATPVPPDGATPTVPATQEPAPTGRPPSSTATATASTAEPTAGASATATEIVRDAPSATPAPGPGLAEVRVWLPILLRRR